MTDEAPAKRGDAAWKHEREAISKRNADAHKRAEGERRSREAFAAAAQRAAADEHHGLADRLRADRMKGRASGPR